MRHTCMATKLENTRASALPFVSRLVSSHPPQNRRLFITMLEIRIRTRASMPPKPPNLTHQCLPSPQPHAPMPPSLTHAPPKKPTQQQCTGSFRRKDCHLSAKVGRRRLAVPVSRTTTCCWTTRSRSRALPCMYLLHYFCLSSFLSCPSVAPRYSTALSIGQCWLRSNVR